MQATQEAIRTHQEEKLEALRNAVLNTALGEGPDFDRKQIFLNKIAVLTPLHVRVLGTMDRNTTRERSLVLQHINDVIPGLRDDEDLSRFILRDLVSHGVVQEFVSEVDDPDREVPQRIYRRSKLGQQFLDFISPPRI